MSASTGLRLSGAPADDHGIKLLTVARLVEKKGVEYGIRAVARILERYPEIRYEIAGDGPLKNDLRSLIADLNIEKNVKLLGWKEQDDIVELMTRADVLLAPSVTSRDGDQEGIPVVLMEALAQGVPVVSTLHSGIPELIEDGVSGFLVPERDAGSLADRLAFLIDNPARMREMGFEGRKAVEMNYDSNKLNDQLVRIYKELIDATIPVASAPDLN